MIVQACMRIFGGFLTEEEGGGARQSSEKQASKPNLAVPLPKSGRLCVGLGDGGSSSSSSLIDFARWGILSYPSDRLVDSLNGGHAINAAKAFWGEREMRCYLESWWEGGAVHGAARRGAAQHGVAVRGVRAGWAGYPGRIGSLRTGQCSTMQYSCIPKEASRLPTLCGCVCMCIVVRHSTAGGGRGAAPALSERARK